MTSELRSVDRAEVYKGDRLVGHLERTAGRSEFVYAPEFLEQSDRVDLATTLAIGEGPFVAYGGSVPAFFSNLLPEGIRLRALREHLKTSLSDEFSLLLAVGHDLIGDVSIRVQGHESETVEMDLEQILDQATWPNLEAGIAGIQSKLSSESVALPIKLRHGPSILKLAPPDLPGLVRNEHFFLRMAATCGLAAANSRIIDGPRGRELLLVERFDRQKVPGGYRKLAQEDGCQLLDRYPADKYRITIQELAEIFTKLAASPRVATLNLAKQVAFSYLIGNSDLHAKNVSLGRLSPGWMPTPAYDLLSTLPYPSIDQRMALKMDGRDDEIRLSDLCRTFQRFGLRPKAVTEEVSKMLDRAEPWLDRLDEIDLPDRETRRLRSAIQLRMATLRQT